MELKIINTGSTGNAYILENDQEALLIECGVHFDRIKQALRFNLSKVVGCIVTHEHQDHARAIEDVMCAGINVYATEGTLKAAGAQNHHRAVTTFSSDEFRLKGFRIKAFDVEHDVAEPVGFLIQHDDCGKVLFVTDSYYCKYTFSGLNNIILEANYSKRILDERLATGMDPKYLRDRVVKSHMSLETAKAMLAANDLSAVNKIVLIHLSDRNSDEKQFKLEVEQQTGKTVHIATGGMTLDFNKSPF